VTQGELLPPEGTTPGRFDLGRGYWLVLPRGPRSQGDLYQYGFHRKRVNLGDKGQLRLLVVELMQHGVNQTRLAEVLDLSRQTLHNYRESFQLFGLEGLLHGYSPSRSVSKELQGRLHVGKRRPGTKARELEAWRRAERQKAPVAVQEELAWDGDTRAIYELAEPSLEDVWVEDHSGESPGRLPVPTVEEPETVVSMAVDEAACAAPQSVASPVEQPAFEEAESAALRAEQPAVEDVPVVEPSPRARVETAPPRAQTEPTSPRTAPRMGERPYQENHDWQPSRYAGIFPVLLLLISQQRWIEPLCRLFGNGWRIFQVFVLMAVRNIRSIEQLKHERRDEAGCVLGIGRLPGLDTLWSWFAQAAGQLRASTLLQEFFADQLRSGLVGATFWFSDGHLLPYTGKEKVHTAWNTQRRLPVPGQTNLVTCDAQGRIVYFEIQEGHGDLRGQILKLGAYAQQQGLTPPPVHVFDREGDGVGFFSELVTRGIPFITWEKNARRAKLQALPAAGFTHQVQFNATEYRLREETKACVFKPPADPATGVAPPEHHFTLRRIVLWNLRTDQRISVLSGDAGLSLPAEMVLVAMLSRWGASENTFKHLQERHPYHYHPGFGLTASEKQEIANPRRKAFAQQIATTRRHLDRLYEQYANSKPVLKKDGSERHNSRHRRLAEEIATSEAVLKKLQADKAQLPERIDVSGLTDYRSFQAIDNEGKNLFDFVTSSVWNVRRQLLDWLCDCYAKDSDRVDLLYAIFHCHGWVRSDARELVVRLEPLQQPARRYAQQQLCRKLTGLGARIPGGKWLRVEVGTSPL